MDTRIYVMTHKEYVKPKDDLYISLHVGRELGEDLGYTGDNTGDNISLKNRNYCELTGLYWLWKNVQCDIVGICHYRRYFIINEDFINKDYIEATLEDYDIIAPNSANTKFNSLREHYINVHNVRDLDLCRTVMEEKYPEYVDAFDLCMNCNLFSLGNMVITKKNIFDEYCQWLFDILFEVEKRTDISEYNTFQARIYGYLSERLFRVWMLYKNYRVREAEVRKMNPEEAENTFEAIELKNKYVNLIFEPLVKKYLQSSNAELFCSEPLPVDFGGKIPVWVMWLQGMEEAPEVVKLCVKSISDNLPKDKTMLIVLTIENLVDYIQLPDWIIKKFEEGKITISHLSDIIRMGLLYRYGGMWIDSAYYVDKTIAEEIFENDFYTIRNTTATGRADIVRGRWSADLLIMKPENVLAKFVLEALYEYWKISDELIVDSLVDYIIALAYDKLLQVRNMIDECPYNHPQVFSLADNINSKWSQDKMDRIMKDTTFFRLSYKLEYETVNIVGDKTIYGYLSDNIL